MKKLICNKCNKEKSIDLFKKFENICKKCASFIETERVKRKKKEDPLFREKINKRGAQRKKERRKENGSLQKIKKRKLLEKETNTKICSICNFKKPFEDFYKNSSYQCKRCLCKVSKQRMEARDKVNPESIVTRRQRKTAWEKKRCETNISYRIKVRLRGRLNSAIKHGCKSGSAVRDLGCTIEELKIYLESKWLPGMNWENHTLIGWHIDHIIPLASFDLTNREQLLKACHYTNLQPLWAKDNIAKRDKILNKE
jgi:hypothetical protein